VEDYDHATLDPDLSINDIAIIGMACRVPGGINSPSELWNFLLRKGDASGDMPAMRWEPYHSRHPRNAEVLARTTSKGYFLDRLEDFDASFFSVSPREAEQMDPQQRIALEVAWEALENAGIPPQQLAGTDTAVYMGVNSDDYGKLILEDLPNVGAHMGVGTAYCGIPSRISYLLNLMGPSIALDAACASSLVAVHQARQAILAGETELAIAGGVNALIGPGLTRVLDEAGAIASDGKCRSFDDSAHGYGRGEGAGVIVLKRLEKALVDGDHVLGILKGSAVCSDGKTLGIMAPNAVAQRLVARKALNEAKIPAESIGYIEAHATSTSLGDPTETEALAQVYGYGVRQPGSNPCFIGSVKSSIGHLEAGAGVLGLIKAVLVLQKGLVPPQANLDKPNTRINWKENMLVACQEATNLPPSEPPARAAIASYGYSGTVSHAIIEAAPQPLRRCTTPRSDQLDSSPVLLLLSAPQANRLPKIANVLARWLETDGASASLEDVAATLSSRRGHHRFRSAIIAETRTDATAALDKLSKGLDDPFVINDRTVPEAAKGPVWVFSGHGAQWGEMGQELYNSRPAFFNVVQQLEPIIQEELGFSAIEALRSGEIVRTDIIQAMTFVMHIGIARVLQEEAGAPSAIVGHSLGEAAASVVAGTITLREAALIVCRRARLYRGVIGQGAMILVTLSIDEARSRIGDRQDISIAIDASPNSCVISGATDSIHQLAERWKQEGIQIRNVRSDVPFHSQMLAKLANPLRESLANVINPKPPKISLYSTSQGDPRAESLHDVEYWVNNMIQPVRLRSTVAAIAKDGYRAFVEVSSHPIVTHSIDETLSEEGLEAFITVPTMIRKQPAMKNILASIGKVYCFGCPVDFTKQSCKAWLAEVPGTIWSHQPYWRAVAEVPLGSKPTHDPSANNLLGSRTTLWGTDQVLFQTRLDEDNKPFPGKHPLHGSEIVPAAVLINTFLQAIPTQCLEDISLKVPVVVSPPRDVQILLDQQQIRITSRLASSEANSTEDGSWLVNTVSRVGGADVSPSVAHLDIDEIRRRLPIALSPTFSVDYLAKVGVPDMGFPWKVLEHIENSDEMLAKVHSNPDDTPGMNDLWASILDSATSIASTIFYREPKLRMPTAVGRVIATKGACSPKVGYIYCRKVPSAVAADVLVCTEDGQVLVEFQAMAFAGIEGEVVSRKNTGSLVHRLAWTPATFAEEPYKFSHVIFWSQEDDSRVSVYRQQLRARGYTTSRTSDVTELMNLDPGTIVVHIPQRAASKEAVFEAILQSCESLITAVKALLEQSAGSKLFSLIDASSPHDPSDLASAPLYGLARIIQSEQPHIWGGLFAVEDDSFPLTSVKYVQGEDVVQIQDGVPRSARLRPFTTETAGSRLSGVQFRPRGTYLITGGLGALGLEVATWMVEQGARRILLVSRRQFPSRSTWHHQHCDNATVQRISALENLGATVHVLSVDISAPDADVLLSDAIDRLSMPPVTGVVHAAGVLRDQLIEEITTEAFNSVLAPKILGALHLDKLFTPGSLDFFVLFSSCGQLLGFPGQASYASGNAFLDAFAAQRRKQGDNSISMMWTSWRGLGMAASTEYINAELTARGITDITTEEAFLAWNKIVSLDTDHAVILRALPLDADEPLPHPILQDIATRRAPAVREPGSDQSNDLVRAERPRSEPELECYLAGVITACVATTLSITADTEIDQGISLSEMGMDSVMTVSFRTQLQQALKVKVAPTLIWKCPTVRHLIRHFMEELKG
jgi:6-methylsalicylic acid synthase